MSMTTDLEGGLFGPSKEDLAAASKVQAAEAYAAGQVQAAKIKEEGSAFGPGSKLLGRPGYAPAAPKETVPVSLQHAAQAAEAGKSLGDPTSFRGGAGAEEPIGVIRGTRQTYATEAGGPNLTEFATPTQAMQAFNREQLRLAGGTPEAMQKFGSFVPGGGEMEALKASYANKRPDLTAAAQEMTRQGYQKQLLGELTREFGVEDKEGKLVLPPEIERLTLGRKVMTEDDYTKLMGEIMPKAKAAHEIVRFNDPKIGKPIRDAIIAANPGAPKELLTRIKTERVTPENIGWWKEQAARAEQVKAGGGAPVPTAQTLPKSATIEEFNALPQAEQQRVMNLAAEAKRQARYAEEDMMPGHNLTIGRPNMQEEMAAAWAEKEKKKKEEAFNWLKGQR